jgi:hypothetical protein
LITMIEARAEYSIRARPNVQRLRPDTH